MLNKPQLFFLIGILALHVAAQTPESVSSLIESELAFARFASEKGIRDAFLAFLAEDSVLFRPRTVKGKQWMTEQPATPGLLSWEPSYAEVSGAGDLGFTTGPFTYAPSAKEPPTSFGQFFSIWKKHPDQTWKVVLDAGINQDKPNKKKVSVTSRSGKGNAVSPELQASEQQKLLLVDQEFSRSSDTKLLSNDLIILRNQELPRNECKYTGEKIDIAGSADLAYTFGTFQCREQKGVYVRVWRKEDRWKLALDYRRADP